MVFGVLYTFYGHGQGSNDMSTMNSDLLDLCTASARDDTGALQCISKGHAITEFSAKQKYMAKVADSLRHCPYKTCAISTPGYPVVAPGFNNDMYK
mmetsp:Transcript_6538/g.15766  ORF Transcript_6538/g.15766 Transcript_6538/m.15766 type:complete len:96 (+) Transcript_6538:176-463(+)|eukprot:CAMPEP_0173430296 /NCGR_PEP_ID=MMETSP1357-20121228/8771_1 /TAXON_ID=77926 /ORGANISM="Hemiselmis rufescens, Strain PCC563" /LENGTH=95 /DNA_ID=CAMNT_0014394611 /DNA_START=110 /DNA_END=397 /DNA_ORIENTATION=+